MELSNLSSTELRELQKKVDAQIKTSQAKEILTAREQIFALAKDAGIDLKSLVESAKGKSKNLAKTVAARYRNPANANEAWTGRGRTPKWAVAMKNAGTFETARI